MLQTLAYMPLSELVCDEGEGKEKERSGTMGNLGSAVTISCQAHPPSDAGQQALELTLPLSSPPLPPVTLVDTKLWGSALSEQQQDDDDKTAFFTDGLPSSTSKRSPVTCILTAPFPFRTDLGDRSEAARNP